MTPTARWGALALLLAPVGVWALGLGEIELKSALNQPLDAEIQLVSATPEELSNLTVGLASRATFDRYGLDRPAYLDGMTFRIGTNDLGRPVILVNSRRPITEPFVTMLVEAIWARGRLLREYTVLLDPPILLNSTVLLPVPEVARSIQPAATGLPDTTRPAGPINRPAPAPVAPPTAINRPAPAPVAPPTVPTAPPLQTREPIRIGAPSSAGGSYGPIRRAETLWAIAEQYRPEGITMNQMLVAIYSANLHAFGGNMNTLYQDVTLRIPQLAELGGVSSVAATQEALRQTALWEGGAASPGSTQQSAAEQRVADQRAAQPVAEQQARLRLVAPPSEPDAGITAGGNTAAATAEIVGQGLCADPSEP